jgi:manganese/zinc/iron transport system ATP- binding protein
MTTAGSVRLDHRNRLVCDELSVHFEHRSALSDITVTFGSGETVSLVGPNGAGKSTLLRVLAGLLPPTHGRVSYDGAPVNGPHPAVIYVPQRTSVDWTFPVSVLDVVLMAAASRVTRLRPFGSRERNDALAALTRTGMERFANIQIGQLSGGQQQRVFLARALLQQGEVYLLDEPFAGVDIPTQQLLVALFSGLRDTGKTILYATHDLAQARSTSDRVLLLNRRLIADGPPGDVMTTTNLQATFGGQFVVPTDVSPIEPAGTQP